MNPYAAGTTVSVERSRLELETLLQKHGASQRGVLSDDGAGKAAVMFVMGGAQYRLAIPLPKLEDFAKDPRSPWKLRSADQKVRAWEQASRERWRAVVLLVKAKLELVRLGVSTVEREFLADLVLPNGETVHGAMAGPLAEALRSGTMPRLLLPEATR